MIYTENKMNRVAFITDDFEGQGTVLKSVKKAAEANRIEIETVDRFEIESPVSQRIWALFREVDLVVANVVYSSLNITYEIGLAHGLQKPVIIITDKPRKLPPDLLNQEVIIYKKNKEGLEQLTFRLTRIIHEIIFEEKKLRGVWGPKEKYITPETSRLRIKTEFRELLFLEGREQHKRFEDWFLELSDGIDGWDVLTTTKFREPLGYDSVIWNLYKDPELNILGNPIVVELKTGNLLRNKIIERFAHKISLQGLSGLVICTTAIASNKNMWLVKELLNKENVAIVLLDRYALLSVTNSKNLIDLIKIRVRHLIYRPEDFEI